MNINLEKQLINYNGEDDNALLEQIVNFKQKSISSKDEQNANYYWLLEHIYIVINGYASCFDMMKHEDFESAWNKLDVCDIIIGQLLDNSKEDWLKQFRIGFIKNQIKEYQKLFPYYLFLSRESVVKRERCSICGKEIKLRHRCQHTIGKLYMGEICLANVEDLKIIGFSIVTNPQDKQCLLKFEGQEFNYCILKKALDKIDSPFQKISVTKEYCLVNNSEKGDELCHTIEWLKSIQKINYSIEIEN